MPRGKKTRLNQHRINRKLTNHKMLMLNNNNNKKLTRGLLSDRRSPSILMITLLKRNLLLRSLMTMLNLNYLLLKLIPMPNHYKSLEETCLARIIRVAFPEILNNHKK
jgi:hypothetical protein